MAPSRGHQVCAWEVATGTRNPGRWGNLRGITTRDPKQNPIKTTEMCGCLWMLFVEGSFFSERFFFLEAITDPWEDWYIYSLLIYL